MKRISPRPLPQVKINGFESAVQTLRGLDAASQERILKNILQKDPKMAEKLRSGLLHFDDLAYLLASDFKLIWWELPRNTWILALRNAKEEVWRMLKSHLSHRAIQELEEQVKSIGPQPLRKVEEAQSEICNAILKLSGEGRMALPKS
jgi:flagellar motor switch protein FliG